MRSNYRFYYSGKFGAAFFISNKLTKKPKLFSYSGDCIYRHHKAYDVFICSLKVYIHHLLYSYFIRKINVNISLAN